MQLPEIAQNEETDFKAICDDLNKDTWGEGKYSIQSVGAHLIECPESRKQHLEHRLEDLQVLCTDPEVLPG